MAVTSALEAFVLAPDDAARGAVLNSQVEGSEAWFELQIGERLRNGLASSPETKDLLDRFSLTNVAKAAQLKLRAKVLHCSPLPEGSEEKNNLLKDLGQESLGLRWQHSAPALERVSALVGSVDGDGSRPPSVLPADALPSKLQVFQKLYNGDARLLTALPHCCIPDVDVSKFQNGDSDFAMRFLKAHQPYIPVIRNQTAIIEQVANAIQKVKARRGGSDGAPSDILAMLSIEQLEILATKVPALAQDVAFVSGLMVRKFPDAFNSDSKDRFSRAEKREVLVKLLGYVDSSCCGQVGDRLIGTPTGLDNLRMRLLAELLQLAVELNDLDKNLVLRYCKEVGGHAGVAGGLASHEFFVQNGTLQSHLPLLQQPPVRIHLKAFILDAGFAEQVKPYLVVAHCGNSTGLPPHVLEHKEAEAQQAFRLFCDEAVVLSGKPLGHTDVNAKWVEELTKRSSIELAAHNPERFEPSADVSLEVRLKNVPQLTAKIYEINLESYYLHHGRPFTADITLDGVGATFEVEYSYSHPPILEHDERLCFEHLSGKQGLFVIDLVGAGLRSRAVIRKGTLLLVHKCTPLGHIAYILGPDREVVTNGAKLHFAGKWYECDGANGGRIVIPFAMHDEVVDVIISALGMAQFSKFARKREQYQLQTAFGLIKESVVMGQNASLLLRPRLLCVGHLCDFGLAKTVEVTLSMKSGSDGVPTVRTYNSLDWSRGDCKVDFLVPPRLKSIEVTLSVEVTKHSPRGSSDVDMLRSSSRWDVTDHSDCYLWFEMYLMRSNGGYEIQCLGKDGEPQGGMTCSLSFEGLLPAQATLTTDVNGVIHLGALQDVTKIIASASGLTRDWQLMKEFSVQYPQSLNVLEGEPIELPSLSESAWLVELGPNKEPIRVCKEALVTSGTGGSLTLKIPSLTRGDYRLHILGAAEIELTVHRGSYWNEGYILRHDAILESKDRPCVISVAEAVARPDGITATLVGAGAQTQVHAVGLRFLPCTLSELTDSFAAVGSEDFCGTKFPFQLWRNIMQSNVRLGDEMSYVLRRRKAEGQVGNLLKKPALLLQPLAVQDTHFSREVVHEGAGFGATSECSYAAQSFAPMMQAMCAPAQMQRACRKSAKRHEECEEQDECPKNHMVGSAPSSVAIQGFQNFLKAESVVLLNLPVDISTGRVVISHDLSNMACVLLMASDARSIAHRLVPVQGWPAATPPISRGLALESPLSCQHFFVEKRTAKPLPEGSSFQLMDQASAEWRAVDSVERLLAFYKAVKVGFVDQLEPWALASWGKFDDAEKAKRWTQHACHEINLFIYSKDTSFFDNIVKPFLQSKMELGIVDHFLLGHTDVLELMLAPPKFNTLNLLEQVLVLRALSEKHPEACKVLAAAFRARAQSKEKAAAFSAHRDTLLNTVLNLEPSQVQEEWVMADTAEVFQFAEVFEPPAACYSRGAWGGPPAAPPRGFPGAPAGPRGFMPHDGALFDVSASEVAAYRSMPQNEPAPWEQVEGTKEYAEVTYKGLSAKGPAVPDFGVSSFWADAAEHAVRPMPRGGFLSPNFIFATKSVHEVACAVALLDFPFAPGSHNLVASSGLAASFDAASPCVFVAKETVAVPHPNVGSDLSVAVRVYKAKLDETSSQDPHAIKEFLSSEPYCLQVIVTNVSPKKLEVQALVQLPQGAVPLEDASYMKAYARQIGAFACWRITVTFYFPRPGKFTSAPVFCSVDGKGVAMSAPVAFNVVSALSSVEVETFADVVQSGDVALVKFLETADLLGEEKGFKFNQLYPLLRKETVYKDVITVLRGRGLFDRVVWGYGFCHGDVVACKELLAVEQGFHKQLGAFFKCPLVCTGVAEGGLAHLEYYPLINKRAHRLGEAGGPPPILHQQLKDTYEALLLTLARKMDPLDDEDRLRLSYYLLCQDRIHEAKQMFLAAGGIGGASAKLQRQYMAAYFDFFDPNSNLEVARKVAEEHCRCPHLKWRECFVALREALAELDDGAAAAADVPNAKPALIAASLSATLQKGTLDIDAQGLENVTVKLYKVDLEMLFSRAPFIEPERLQSEFSFVKPVFEKVLLGSTRSWALPDSHRSSDLAVEVVGNDTRIFRMHFASPLRVAAAERHGWLTVTNEAGRPLPAIYVKVFARMRSSSTEPFFKDGYTDLRGRFEYASLSGTSTSDVARFSVLVISDKTGGIVLEAIPPAQARS